MQKQSPVFIDIHAHRLDQLTANTFALYCPLLPDELHISHPTEKIPQYHFSFPHHPFGLGLHPWWVEQLNLASLWPIFKQAVEHKFCLAFGEIGLDRAVSIDFELQKNCLQQQLEWLEEHAPEIPLVIHCVRAYPDIWSILKPFTKHRAILFHDYNGNQHITEQLLKQGNSYFCFGKKLFQSRTHAYRCFDQLPLDRIFLETDDQTEYSIQAISLQAAKLRNLELEELLLILRNNLESCFPQVRRLGVI